MSDKTILSVAIDEIDRLRAALAKSEAEKAEIIAEGRQEIANMAANYRKAEDALRAELAKWKDLGETALQGCADNALLRAELAAAQDRIKHMETVLIDAEDLLGVEETGELILRPIERLKADLAAVRAELVTVHTEFNGRIDRLNDDNNRLRSELAAAKVHQDATCCMLDEAQSDRDKFRAELAALQSHRRTEEK